MCCTLSHGLFLCVLCFRGNQQLQRCCLLSGKGHVQRGLCFSNKNEIPAFCQYFVHESFCLWRRVNQKERSQGGTQKRWHKGPLGLCFFFEAGLFLPVVTQVRADFV